jgi:peptidoglycan L-alanyl-D-glutamate endopeptidase CwlK
MDSLTIKRIGLLHPKLRNETAEIYEEICKRITGPAFCRFTFTLRTIKEQDELYAQGRTKPGAIVTNARGGMSYHNYGLAVDIAFVVAGLGSWDEKKDYDKDGNSDWMEVVQVFKEHGWEWGGDWNFKDLPHFQNTFGYSVRQLKNLPKNQDGYPII